MKILEDYKNYLSATDKRESTKASYLLDVGRLLKQFDEDKLPDITQEDIQSYCDALLETRKISTVSRTVSSARAFWNYLIEQGVCGSNPATGIRLKEPVAPEIFGRIITPGRKNIQDLRDKCIITLLDKTIIKQSVIVELNVGSVDIEKKRIILPDNTSVRISRDTVKILQKYLSFLESVFIPPENPLFMNRDGGRLSRQGIWKITKQALDKARQRQEAEMLNG